MQKELDWREKRGKQISYKALKLVRAQSELTMRMENKYFLCLSVHGNFQLYIKKVLKNSTINPPIAIS